MLGCVSFCIPSAQLGPNRVGLERRAQVGICVLHDYQYALIVIRM